MDIKSLPKNVRIIVAVVLFIISISGFILLLRGTNVVNPASNTLDENPAAGRDYALLYNQSELFNIIENNEANLDLIQDDLELFARTTRSEFSDPASLVGFTFEKGFKQSNNNYTFTGYFFSVNDKIEVVVSLFDRGVIRLSITNTGDGTNIDEFLNLNGSKNRLLDKLPIDTDFYSVNYQRSEDKILVAFYKGYSTADVDAALAILREAYDGAYPEEDVTFNINAVGIFTLQEVRDYVSNPDNQL